MSTPPEELVNAVLLEAASKDTKQSVLCGQTLAKLFNNVLENPHASKYRKISSSNKTLSERVFSINGTEELLTKLGWQKEGDTLILPAEASLELMRTAATSLECKCGGQVQVSDSELANQILAGRRDRDDFFSRIFGFKEWTKLNFMKSRVTFSYDAKSGVLRSKACRGREFMAGFFSTPSLDELRARVDLASARSLGGSWSVVEDVVDVGQLHNVVENRGAVFQAASQFNCLEHARPTGTPEDGISCYAHDRTQGPACALACLAGTVIRNYFAFDGLHGQTVDKQVTNLKDVEAVLGLIVRKSDKVLGNADERFFKVHSGYTMAHESNLVQLQELLSNDERLREEVRKNMRIGIQADTEVMTAGHGRIVRDSDSEKILVTQTYCSAVSVSHSGCSPSSWQLFASIVLEAAYEATILVGIENALKHPELPGSRKVFLTALGGGAFGNEHSWIVSAMSKAFAKFSDIGLEVHLVSYKTPMFADFVT
jgi:hypothetical protein